MQNIFLKGATSQNSTVPLRDSTTGQLKTGIVFGSVTIKYQRDGVATATTVTAVSGTLGTFTSSGWVETQVAGEYQFSIPDAALATGAEGVTITFIASGCIDKVIRIVLINANLRDGVRMGLTSLPNVAQGTTGALPTGNAAGKVTVLSNEDKTGYALTSGERTAIANQVETQIMDETDGRTVLQAIVNKINSVDADLSGLSISAIVAGVWGNGTRSLTDKTNFQLAANQDVRNVSGNVAGSVATVTSIAAGGIDSNSFAAGAIVAAAIAANALNGKGDWATTSGATAQQIWDFLLSAATTTGSTGKKLSDLSGGTITPILVQANNPRFSTRDLPNVPAGSAPADAFTVVDANSAAIDLSGKTVRFVAYVDSEGDADNAFDDTVAAVFKYETGGAGVTISGASNNVVTVQHSAANTATVRDLRYMLWNVTDKLVLCQGKLPIVPAVFNT